MDSSVTYHVTCASSSRKKLITVSSKDDIINKIQSVFGVNGHVILQQSYEDDWVDVDDPMQLPDGGKLRFLTVQSDSSAVMTNTSVPSSPSVMGSGASTSAEPSSPTVTLSSTTTSVVPSPGNSNVLEPPNDKTMRNYQLPAFPPHITAALIRGSTDIVTCRKERSKIITALFDDLRYRIGW